MKTIILTLSFLLLTTYYITYSQPIIADHSTVSEFGNIPDSVIREIRANSDLYYGHTSHGSQIMSGIALLQAEDTLYSSPYFYEYGDDLGHNGDLTWVQPTCDYLDSHPACNIVMWSWCGGASDNTEIGVNAYLDAYNQLEIDYPGVTFVYMTGHLDGTGPDGNLYYINNIIRDYCQTNSRILFDFADIESYDPDGVYYPDETDACGWCPVWCLTHSCPSCGCAHSQCFNCYQKGKSFWWMMAKVIGWGESTEPICGDADDNGIIDILDITFIMSYLYQGGPAPNPIEIGDVNSDGSINMLDITYVIAYLYDSGPELNCP